MNDDADGRCRLAPVTLGDLPPPDDPRAVFAFAMTFNAYEHFGSFEAAAAVARSRRRATLDDLRAELFMAARGSRHRGDEDYLETYRDLLPLLRRHLTGADRPAGAA